MPRVSYSRTIRFVKEGNRIEPGRTAAKLAREVFTAHFNDVHALTFYLLDACLFFAQDWKKWVKNDMVVYRAEVERE